MKKERAKRGCDTGRRSALVGVLRLAIGALVFVALGEDCNAANPPPRGSLQERIAGCTKCHGAQGEGGGTNWPYQPRLAGLPPEYFLAQIQAYQSGRRQYRAMQYMVENLSQAYVTDIAEYFAHQQGAPYNTAAVSHAPELLRRGKVLALKGDASLGVEPCTKCHGSALEGDGRQAPFLAGQNYAYTAWQMEAWKIGRRSTAPESRMADIARRLSSDDIRAVSAYLASVRPGELSQTRTASEVAGISPASEPTAASVLGDFEQRYPLSQEARKDPRVVRGRYLAIASDCIGCHTADAAKPFAGGVPLQTPYGAIYSSNITPDRKFGIGNWTGDQFYKALHSGIAPGWKHLFPAFPYTNYSLLSRDDVDAIKAYVDALPPVAEPSKPDTLMFPLNLRLLQIGWRVLFFHDTEFRSDPGSEISRGEYLVKGPGHCSACHTPRNFLSAERDDYFLAGGFVEGWHAPNIRSGTPAGIGDWDVNEIVLFLRTGQSQHGTASLGPMRTVINNSLQYLRGEDLRAIAVYLKSLPPKAFEIDQEQTTVGPKKPVPAAEGAAIYQEQCAACHSPDGRGRAGDYPPLAENPVVGNANPTNVIKAVLMGGFPAATERVPLPYSMPPFSGYLSDHDVAAVVSYIRGTWGNHASTVSPAQVDALR